MNPLAVRYHSNGTGRDSYIGVTNGGLSGVYSDGDFKQKFKDSLRTSTERLVLRQSFEKRGGHSTGLSKSNSTFLKRTTSDLEF